MRLVIVVFLMQVILQFFTYKIQVATLQWQPTKAVLEYLFKLLIPFAELAHLCQVQA